MDGFVTDLKKAKAKIKVTIPDSMRKGVEKTVPKFETLGFATKENARDAVRHFLNSGIQAVMV